MAEYQLVCDVCHESMSAPDAMLSWREDATAKREWGFVLSHTSHAPADATARREGRWLAWPNGYLTFFADRFSRLSEGWSTDAAALESLLHALAPFALRPDTGVEMDSYRAASFGQRMGIKPGAEKEIEGGK
jgi:hypothetical protein